MAAPAAPGTNSGAMLPIGNANAVKTSAPMMYQLDTYSLSRLRLKKGGRNWIAASTSASTVKKSTMSGNSAHSRGWLTPLKTSPQPGAITAKFQTKNSQTPILRLVTANPVRMGTE